MKIFYAVLICMFITAIFYWLLVSPLYRKVSEEKKILVAIGSSSHKTVGNKKEKEGGYNMVEQISRIANSVGIDAETSMTSGNDASRQLIHIKASGDYQQLMQLVIDLVGESKNLFVISLSMFATDVQENEGNLEMDATFGVYM